MRYNEPSAKYNTTPSPVVKYNYLSRPGSTSIQFTLTAKIISRTTLRGLAQIRFTASGDLTNSSVAVSGRANISFSTIGYIIGSAPVSGNALINLDTKAKLGGKGYRSGLAVINISTNANLRMSPYGPQDSTFGNIYDTNYQNVGTIYDTNSDTIVLPIYDEGVLN